MALRGRMKYIPKDILEELNVIKLNKNLKDSEAFREMKKYSSVGREVERLMNFGFGKQKRQ